MVGKMKTLLLTWVILTSKGYYPQVVKVEGTTLTDNVYIEQSFKDMGFPVTLEVVVTKKRLQDNRAGETDGIGTFKCNIAIDIDTFKSLDYLKDVLWHEYGHCAGLDHNPRQGTIMYYRTEGGFSHRGSLQVLDWQQDVCKLTKSFDCP